MKVRMWKVPFWSAQSKKIQTKKTIADKRNTFLLDLVRRSIIRSSFFAAFSSSFLKVMLDFSAIKNSINSQYNWFSYYKKMTLTQEEIQKIAENLAKLQPKNVWKLTKSANVIIDYFNLLQEVDTDWVTPTVNVVQKENTLRKDELKKDEIVTPSELLACSHQKVIANQIALPNIMK